MAQAPPPAAQTASERLAAAREAFRAKDYAGAEKQWAEFIEIYGAEPQVAAALEEIKPLRALAKLRLKQYAEATPLLEEALASPQTPKPIAVELSFWRGLCRMQAKDYRSAQVALGEFYRAQKSVADQRSRCHEALLLFGVCSTLLGEHADAVDFLSWQMPRLRRESKEVAARATILLLYSMLEAGQRDAALDFVLAQYADIDSVTQLISFQSLILDLGSRFLDQGEYHSAIACLQRVWKRDRLIQYQGERLVDLDHKLEILRARGLEEFIFQYEGMRRRVEVELERFKEIPNFDAALRLRLATAFQGLGRFREAALVMEDMLQTMEPGPIVAGASVTSIQCWMEIEHWAKAIGAADTFVERFGEDGAPEQLPVVLFLKARSLHNDSQREVALEAFRSLYRKFPEAGVAGDALFMQGIVLLEMDRCDEAIALFEDMQRELPGHGRAEDAFYWQGMGYSFAGEHERARSHLQDYLKAHPKGRYVADSVFRRAFSLFSLADYPAAITDLRAYLSAHVGDRYNDEAQLLLGDSLLAEGDLDEGMASYAAISPLSTRFFEDGWFKTGKALKLRKDYEKMRAHYQRFISEHAASNRMAEAVYWVGWTHTAEGNEAKAKSIYWQTIDEVGNRPELYGIADLLDGLSKLYRGNERPRFVLQLRQLAQKALKEKLPTLELRARWAIGMHSDPESADRRSGFDAAVRLCDPEQHNPRILADCGDYLLAKGSSEDADAMFADLRKWHPRAVDRDRAFLGRARIALAARETEQALAFLKRMDEETPYSARLAEAKTLRAKLLADSGEKQAALAVLEELLADKALPSAAKADALFSAAEILASDGEELKATAYFERVYVAYGKYRDLVAKSYLRRGELLEKLDRRDAAVEVYRELAGREDLSDRGEPREARSRLRKMGEEIDA